MLEMSDNAAYAIKLSFLFFRGMEMGIAVVMSTMAVIVVMLVVMLVTVVVLVSVIVFMLRLVGHFLFLQSRLETNVYALEFT